MVHPPFLVHLVRGWTPRHPHTKLGTQTSNKQKYCRDVLFFTCRLRYGLLHTFRPHAGLQKVVVPFSRTHFITPTQGTATPREALLFSAMLRMPQGTSKEAITQKVTTIPSPFLLNTPLCMHVLGIEGILSSELLSIRMNSVGTYLGPTLLSVCPHPIQPSSPRSIICLWSWV